MLSKLLTNYKLRKERRAIVAILAGADLALAAFPHHSCSVDERDGKATGAPPLDSEESLVASRQP